MGDIVIKNILNGIQTQLRNIMNVREFPDELGEALSTIKLDLKELSIEIDNMRKEIDDARNEIADLKHEIINFDTDVDD